MVSDAEFRRETALHQAVEFWKGMSGVTPVRVIRSASMFEAYLLKGVVPSD